MFQIGLKSSGEGRKQMIKNPRLDGLPFLYLDNEDLKHLIFDNRTMFGYDPAHTIGKPFRRTAHISCNKIDNKVSLYLEKLGKFYYTKKRGWRYAD